MSTPDRAYHHGDLRRALIGAALEILDERGVDALSLREVARRAGVSAMAPYRHFQDKAALLAAVREQGFHGLLEALAAADKADAPRRALAEQGVAYVRFAVERPALFRLMMVVGKAERPPSPHGPTPSQAAYEVLQNRVRDLVPAEQVATAVTAAWSLVHGLASLALDGALPEPLRLAEQVTNFFVDGLSAR